MATPLEVRNRRREAQRTVRLALNAINSSLDAWKKAIGAGKRQATDLTNAILTQGHLPVLPLGVLSDVPHLRRAAAAKLLAQQRRLLEELHASMCRLEAAAQGLAAAAAAVAEVAEREAAGPLLGGAPVFTALPLPSIPGMLREVAAAYAAELRVKRVVVRGFEGACRDAARRGGEAEGGGGGGGGGEAAERYAALEGTLQVHITAWMLDVEVDECRVQEHLRLLSDDANSV